MNVDGKLASPGFAHFTPVKNVVLAQWKAHMRYHV